MSRTSTGSSSRRSRPALPPPGEAPTDAAAVEGALLALGIRPSRTLGQSFLIDPFVADAEAALLGPAHESPVIEVGGGLGALTAALLRRGIERPKVVERDPRLARYLRQQFGSAIEVVEADALELGYPRGTRVIGNLPFSVATPLLVKLWEDRVPRVVAMVQREVAERIGTGPGTKQFGRLSVLARLYGETELYRTVPSRAFFPEPKIEGRILVHEARKGPLPVPSVERFAQIMSVLFSARRKQLGNLLPRLAPNRDRAFEWADRAGWPSGWPRLRPEDLPSEAYFALARAAAP